MKRFAWLLNQLAGLALTVCLLLQSHVIIEFLSRGQLEAPAFLLRQINERVQLRGATVAADALVYFPGGRIEVVGLRLGDVASRAKLAEVGQLTLWRSSSIEEDQLPISRLELQGGRLFTGELEAEPLLSEIEARLSFSDVVWELQHLQARHALLTVSVNGELPQVPKVNIVQRTKKRLLRDPKPVVDPVPDLASSLQAVVAGLDAFFRPIIQAGDTHLHLSLTTDSDSPSRLLAQAQFHSGRLVTDYGALGPLVAAGSLMYDLSRRDYEIEARGRVESVRSPQFGVRAGDVQLFWQAGSLGSPMTRLQVATGEIHYGLETIDRAVLSAALNSLQSIQSEGIITLDRTTQLAAQAEVNLLRGEGDVYLSGKIDPILLIEHPLLEPIRPRLPIIEFGQSPYLNARVQFARGFQFQSASLRARVEPLRLDDLAVDYADGLLTTDGVQFKVERALLETSPHHGYVSASFDADSGDYAVALEGIFDPNSISSIVGSWWDSIFSPFDFSEIGASWADFIIRGNQSEDRPRYFNGSVDAKSVGFEGLQIDSGHLKVRGTPSFVELFDLYAMHASGGTVTGSIFWKIIPYSDTGPEIYHLLLDAQIDPAVIVPALPPAAARWASAFTVEQAPAVHLEVRQFNPVFDPPADANSVFIRARSSRPVTFEGIPMDSLAFTYYGKGDRSFLREAEFRLADGKGTLALDRWFASDKPQVRFRFVLENALRLKALTIVNDYLARVEADADAGEIPAVPPPAPDEAVDVAEPLTGGSDVARISVRLNAEGPEEQPLEFVGSGHFLLKDPELATIPLLGPISRIFEGTPLGFTSLRLNTMKGDFRLRREQVFFPQLKIVGSVGEVEATGTYRIPDKGIDFRLRVSLFGGLIETPVGVLRRITRNINPFPGILEGNLTGTLDEPRWRSAYDPRSWLPFVGD
jgi:hypothetical protein